MKDFLDGILYGMVYVQNIYCKKIMKSFAFISNSVLHLSSLVLRLSSTSLLHITINGVALCLWATIDMAVAPLLIWQVGPPADVLSGSRY